jgi:hypothetical protein
VYQVARGFSVLVHTKDHHRPSTTIPENPAGYPRSILTPVSRFTHIELNGSRKIVETAVWEIPKLTIDQDQLANSHVALTSIGQVAKLANWIIDPR